MDNCPKVIDIETAIRNSRSKFVRSLPGFIVGCIIRYVHQDEMNATIHKFRNKTGVAFVDEVLKEWNVKIVINGSENIPNSGKYVFVANHPVGAIDALSFLSMIHRYFPDVVSPSNELFNYIPQLRPVILGVNVFGKNTRQTADKLNQLFESDSQIMIFPSGEVSRMSKGVISDPPWQKTFITKAVQYKRDIIPVHISGRNSGLFYTVANLRKLFGIKLYIETMLLPREMMKQRDSIVTMTIGEIIPWQTFSRDKSHDDWAQIVKELVYNIK